MGVDRQLSHKGADAWCKHVKREDVKNYADKVIGRQCTKCGALWGLTTCTGCLTEKFCELVSADGTERFCTRDCRGRFIGERAKAPRPRGRK